MTINLQDYNILKGAFADVIIDIPSKRAYKLFKSYDHPDLAGTGKEEFGPEKTNKYRQQVFKTEFDAYEFVKKSEVLKKYTPAFYGKLEITNVFNGIEDITFNYLTECCFEMEYIQGDSEKLDVILGNSNLIQKLEREQLFNVNEIFIEFVKAGIKYIKDSSVIYNTNDFKIIDFATLDPYKFEPIIGMD